MMRIFSMALEAGAAGVFLLPLLLLLNKYHFHSRRRTAVYFMFTLYLAAMYAVAGLPNVTYMRFEPHFQLIPFVGMISDLSNCILNVLLFVPLGFFLPLLGEAYRRPRSTILMGFCTSAAIETLQILTFRATDVNDLITNTLGAAIGWLPGSMLLKKLPVFLSAKSKGDVPLLYGCVFIVMFFLQPFLSAFLWDLIY